MQVAKALSLRKLGTVHFSALRWKDIPGVSPDQLHAWLTGLPPTCKRFDGAWKIMQWLIRLTAHSHFCPIVRYFYPFEDTYNTNVMESVFGYAPAACAACVDCTDVPYQQVDVLRVGRSGAE